ncbi:hypothetical protein Tco_0140114 [Tanacetum coccineum]
MSYLPLLPSPPLPPLTSSLYIPPPGDRKDDIPESEQPPCKRLCLSTLGSRYEVGESSTARPTRGQGIDYGFVSTVDAEERRQGIRDIGSHSVAELHEHDTTRLDMSLLEDAQDISMGLSVREEAYASREAWAHSIGLSQATHQELQTHRDHVYTHETHLQAHPTQLQLQAELLALREQQRRARQPGPEARIPDHQDASRDANSHI